MSFYAATEHKFSPVPDDLQIETLPFLDASNDFLHFFELLGIGKIKEVMGGNIMKLKGMYYAEPERCRTLQAMIQRDIDAGKTKDKESAAWLILMVQRSLSFGRAITDGILGGEKDIYKLACEAHVRYLKPHQPWFVQKMFGMLLKSVTKYEGLMTSLGKGTADEQTVLNDMRGYLALWGANLDTLCQYTEKALK